MSDPEVLVLGPAAWNTLLVFDELPQPVPHMEVARDSWETVGGTSAGKALHLADAGVRAQLWTPLADDEAGRRVRRALGGLDLRPLPTDRTERHVNLMDAAGRRVSLYAVPPASTTPPSPEEVAGAGVLVLDLAPWTRELALALDRGTTTVWCDLHDVDDEGAWHAPFRRISQVVQCSADRLSDPLGFLRAAVADGAELAICTMGAEGALAVDAEREYRVPAERVDVVDGNGAGDAFLSGVLAARLRGEPVEVSLAAGVRQSLRALCTRDLGPGVLPV